jgi:hypothetical protein
MLEHPRSRLAQLILAVVTMLAASAVAGPSAQAAPTKPPKDFVVIDIVVDGTTVTATISGVQADASRVDSSYCGLIGPTFVEKPCEVVSGKKPSVWQAVYTDVLPGEYTFQAQFRVGTKQLGRAAFFTV